MDNRYHKLIKNTALYAIGEFANKVLGFLIIPLYTYVLTPEEYGRIDLFTTAISFLVPIITLQIQEAMLRYLLGKDIDKQTAVGNCWAVFSIGSVITAVLWPVYCLIFEKKYACFFVAAILTNAFNGIFTHYLRAIGKNTEYVAKGVLCTAINLCCNVLLVLILKMGMDGYLYSLLISQCFGVVYLLVTGNVYRCFHFRYVKIAVLLDMLRFSVPLIPNTMMWWVMSAGDKYIINWHMGDGANGLYSLALKIPTIISVFYSLFYQAWQMSAIEENQSADRKHLYTTVFRNTTALLFILVSGMMLCIKPLCIYVMDERFSVAWEYIPLLLIGTALNCQASFFGVVYTTTKNTIRVFFTTALGAMVNIALNLILVKPFGLQGVAFGTCMGYAAVLVIRAIDTYKEIQIDFDVKRVTCGVIILIIQLYTTLRLQGLINWTALACLAIIICIYRAEIELLLCVLRSKLNEKRVTDQK